MNRQEKKDVVLVVDDEPLVRYDTSQTLCRAGFEVCEAASVHEALTVLHERPDVTILLTDVQMACLSGVDLANHVRQTRPAIRVLLISGGRRPAEVPDEMEFLSKPCPTDTLIARVRNAATKR